MARAHSTKCAILPFGIASKFRRWLHFMVWCVLCILLLIIVDNTLSTKWFHLSVYVCRFAHSFSQSVTKNYMQCALKVSATVTVDIDGTWSPLELKKKILWFFCFHFGGKVLDAIVKTYNLVWMIASFHCCDALAKWHTSTIDCQTVIQTALLFYKLALEFGTKRKENWGKIYIYTNAMVLGVTT